MKKILILLALLPLTVYSQVEIQNNVLATAGNSQSNANIQLEYTLGEVFTQRFLNGTRIITQGFHQPIKLSFVEINPDNPLTGIQTYDINSLKIYPNPTYNSITVDLGVMINCKATLYDMAGRLITTMELYEIKNTINLTPYESGTYQLVLSSDQIDFARIPVIKAN